MYEPEELEVSWKELVRPLEVPENVSFEIFKEIRERHSEPWRYYHTLYHVSHILLLLEWAEPGFRRYPAMSFAAWFHDIVYDTHRKDNEEQSAVLAMRILEKLKVPHGVRSKTVRLIRNTANTGRLSEDYEMRIFHDTDLGILGVSREDYLSYAANIRKEYDWVEEDVYRDRRRRFLKGVLACDPIYHVQKFRAEFESPARENIRMEIEEMLS